MKYIIKAYNILELGQRTNQEDSIFPALGEVRDSDRLFILCDGMGGHESGEVASSTVCGAMSRYILQNCPDPEGEFSDETFGRALAFALDELDKKDTGAKKKMGTTMTFLKLHDKGCTIAHIGDSRVYHIRPGQTLQETRILHQTGDHSLVNDLVKLGEITAEEAKYSKQKNVITRAMQPCMERRPRADIYHTHDIKAGDYFFMCSDGILEDWDDDNVKYTFCNKGGRNDNEKIEMLVKATSMHKDNHSAIIIHVMKVIDPLPVQKPQPVPYMAEIEDDKPVPKRIPTWKKLIAGFAIGIAIGGLIAYVVPKFRQKATITFMAKEEGTGFKTIGIFKDTVGAEIDTEKIDWEKEWKDKIENYYFYSDSTFREIYKRKKLNSDDTVYCSKEHQNKGSEADATGINEEEDISDDLSQKLSNLYSKKVNKDNYIKFVKNYNKIKEKFEALKQLKESQKQSLQEKLNNVKKHIKGWEKEIIELHKKTENSVNKIKQYAKQSSITKENSDNAKNQINDANENYKNYLNKAGTLQEMILSEEELTPIDTTTLNNANNVFEQYEKTDSNQQKVSELDDPPTKSIETEANDYLKKIANNGIATSRTQRHVR